MTTAVFHTDALRALQVGEYRINLTLERLGAPGWAAANGPMDLGTWKRPKSKGLAVVNPVYGDFMVV